MDYTRLVELLEGVFDSLRRPVTPFEDLDQVGASFLVVGGDIHQVRVMGRAYLDSDRGAGRDLEYTVCSRGVLVTLVEADDLSFSRLVHLDPERGFLAVDRVRVTAGVTTGTVLVTQQVEGLSLPDEVGVSYICRKTVSDLLGFFKPSDASPIDVPF